MAEMSRYDLLLQQVECLKLENSSLKKELCTNTSQISRLESEASSLKEMVVMLGNSINTFSSPLDGQESFQNDFHSNFKRSTSYSNVGILSPRHIPSISISSLNHYASPLNCVPSEIRIKVDNLQSQRLAILDSLKREESAKERYMRQLNDLNDKLKGMLDADKTGEATRQLLEYRIREVQQLMEKDLGSHEMMEHRVQDWLSQIRIIDSDIENLDRQYLMLEPPAKPPCAADGSFERHKIFFHNCQSLADISTQTPHCMGSFEILNQEQSVLAPPSPLGSVKGQDLYSRATQTLQTCLTIHPPTDAALDISNLHCPAVDDDTSSMFSFTTSLPRYTSSKSTGTKVDVIELISKLGSHDPEDMSRTFHSLSLSVDSSNAMRQAGCLPLLIQLLHDGSILLEKGASPTDEQATRRKEMRGLASQALRNIVCSNISKGRVKIESHILVHLEVIRNHSEVLFKHVQQLEYLNVDKTTNESMKITSPVHKADSIMDKSTFNIKDALLRSMQEVMRLSYNESIRGAINDLGGLFCVAELLILDCRIGSLIESDDICKDWAVPVRQYAGLTLTNLTFGDSVNKGLLINMQGLLEAVIKQLKSKSEDIQQAMASILRNLSWQADKQGRELLRQKGVVKSLTKSVIHVKREITLKSMLSALWNLSGHCPQNRIDICDVQGSLAFLVSTLTFRSPSKSTHVIESGGGILRNISSIIATNEDYRKILRKNNCLQVLLKQVVSPSLTIVSNACGTLWNLSARDQTDQEILLELGAVSKLRKLIHSKHKVIAQGSSAALRNLLFNRPDKLASIFSTSIDPKNDVPSLQTRKLKQLECELKKATSQSTSELSENFSPRHHALFANGQHNLSISSQRHSLQERVDTSTLTEHKQEAGACFSGSLGNVSQQTFAVSPGMPFKAWETPKNVLRNTLPYASSASAVISSSEGKAQTIHTCTVSERPYIGACSMMRIPQLAPSFNNPVMCDSSDMKIGRQPNQYDCWEIEPVKHWSKNRNMKNNTAAADCTWPLQKSASSQAEVVSPSRMPTDLVEKLRHANDDYSMQEDDDVPVDYSLQYTDELRRTPGIQSPRTEEMFEKSTATQQHRPNASISKSNSLQKTAAKAPILNVKERPEGFSACNSNNKSNISELSNDALKSKGNNFPARVKIDPSVEQRIMYADEEIYDMDETPTNFGAIYAEEQLFEHISCTDAYMLQRYPGMNDNSNANSEGCLEAPERVKKYNVEDTPICFSTHSSLSDLHGDTNGHHASTQHKVRNADQLGDVTELAGSNSSYPDNEEDDKFDTNPGTITPGNYFKSGRYSGMMTPRTPMYQETPIMYSPSSSRSSLESCDQASIHSDVTSEPGSRMLSGVISPSDLPDSPGQSMPVSRCRSPKSIPEVKGSMLAIKCIPVPDEVIEKSNDLPQKRNEESKLKCHNSSLSDLAGIQLIRKAHAMSAGYLATLPPCDEMTCYITDEPAMSEMTSFSGFTIDDENVKPLSNNKLSLEKNNEDKGKVPSDSRNAESKDNNRKDAYDAGGRAIMQAGYITSLPTNDEIKHFVCEGSMSPLTGLSEISALRSHNNGFQKCSGGSPKKFKTSASNRNSYTSRSSATGASVPLPPISVQSIEEPVNKKTTTLDVDGQSIEVHHLKSIQSVSQCASSEKSGDIESDLSHDDDCKDLSDFLDSSSDDNELLEKCIKMAMPKKNPNKVCGSKSRKSSGKLKSQSQKSAHQSPSTNVTEKDCRIKGQDNDIDIVPCKLTDTKPAVISSDKTRISETGKQVNAVAGYITSMPTSDEIKQFVYEGALSPVACLSEISALHNHNEGFNRTFGSNKLSEIKSSNNENTAKVNMERNNGSRVPNKCECFEVDSKFGKKNHSKSDIVENVDLSDFLDSSSDDTTLLEQFIELAIPDNNRTTLGKMIDLSNQPNKQFPSCKSAISKTAQTKTIIKKSDTSTQSSQQHGTKPVHKYDTRDRIAAADLRLNGVGILQYIEDRMSCVPGYSSDGSGKEVINNAIQDAASTADMKEAPKWKDETEGMRRTCQQVIKTVETLDESYSVMKQLRVTDKKNDMRSIERTKEKFTNVHNMPVMCQNAKVQAFLQNRPKTFATEGTPMEISRSTSLSNLTVDSGPDSYDFSALQRKMSEKASENFSNTGDSAHDDAFVDSTKKVANLNCDVIYTGRADATSDNYNNNSNMLNFEKGILNNTNDILDDLETQSVKLTRSATATPRNDAGITSSLFHMKEMTNITEGPVNVQTNYSGHSGSASKLIINENRQQQQMFISCDQFSHSTKLSHSTQQSAPDKEPTTADVQSQHYGDDFRDIVKDKPLSYGIEDTPLRLSGNSSLSSINIDSDGDVDDLLIACISSAMPVARKDPAAAVPPNQLALSNEKNQLHHNTSEEQMTNVQVHLNSLQPPGDAEWAIVHRGANAAADQLTQGQQLNAISPLSLVSLSSPDQPSTSFSLSTGPVTQTSDGYYRLSRQPSIGDSINSEMSVGSLVLGGDARSLMKSQNKNKPKIIKGRNLSECCPADDKPIVVNGGKKIYRSPITGKPRENLRYPSHSKDNISSESSSNNRVMRRNRNSGSNKSPCNKCHPPQSRQLPASSSMGRLEDASPGRPFRKKKTSSVYSKPGVTSYGHVQEIRKPVRSRSAHAGYNSCVTQLYPPLEQINSIMLNGVASMAARGEMVVGQYEGQTTQFIPVQYGHNTNPIYHRPVLVKQGTFIQDEPSPTLLQSVSQNLSKARKSGNNAQYGKNAKKASGLTNNSGPSKSKITWKGLKKLLSPNDENKSISSGVRKKIVGKHQLSAGTNKQIFDVKSDDDLRFKDIQAGMTSNKSNALTKRKGQNTLATSANKTAAPKKIQVSAKHVRSVAGSSRSSSLSLSSSSVSNGSSGSVDFLQQQQPGRSIYPTAGSISASSHIPKSPAAKARMVVGKSPTTSTKSLSGSRRSPSGQAVIKSQFKTESQCNTSVDSSSSASSFAQTTRGIQTKSAVSPKSRHGSHASLSTSRCVGKISGKNMRSSVSSHQHGSVVVSVYEVPQSPVRTNLADSSQLFSSPIRRVVQEVAPFNYKPTRVDGTSSDHDSDQQKIDVSRKQTTV